MMDIAGSVLWTDCGGISTSSPVAEVKRTASESPYTSAVAITLLRGLIAIWLTKFFQIIVCLRRLRCGHGDDLADRSCSCARAIALPAARLLLTHASAPIARRLAGQLFEGGSEGRLRGVAKLRRDRHDRYISVAQHVHGLLEPVLAQPGMR